MKLKLAQLKNHLTTGLKPIYVVSGDEPLQLREACDLVRQGCQQSGFEDRQIFDVSARFNWQQLLNAANSLSLFSQQTLLDVRMQTAKPGQLGGKALVTYATDPPEDKVLLITTQKLDASAQKSNWFKAIDKVGVIVQIWPIDAQQLPQWISHRMQQFDLTADSQAIAHLAEQTQGNLLATAQEIEKLSLRFGASHLSLEAVANSIADNARFDIFGLIDTILQGNAEKITRTIVNLQASALEPILVLWGLTRELRTLAQMATLLKQGQSLSQLFSQFRVWEKRKPLLQRALKLHSQHAICQLLLQAAIIDRMIKGAAAGDPWNELARLSLNLGTGARA